MWINAVQMALESFSANKVRTALTMLGIVIGTAAVIALTSIGAGFRAKVDSQIASMGANILMIFPGMTRDGHSRRGRNIDTLTLEDSEALVRELDGIEVAAPQLYANLQARVGDKNASATIVGTTADYPRIRSTQTEKGRFFNQTEEARSAPLAVLGPTIAKELLGADRDPIGASIVISDQPFKIIGVMEKKGASGYSRYDEYIYIPLGAAQNRLIDKRTINRIDISIADRESMDRSVGEIERVLMRRHRIADPNLKDFVVYNQSDLAAVTESIMGTIQIFLAVVASISLIVGGVGIMNIMLVSVTERTREIGLLKAVGATRKHIRIQFLLEAITLCLLGGALGIALGIGATYGVGRWLEWETQFTPASFALAAGFSAAVGLFFGLYPAEKAARLNPIEALRHE